jgi:Branched-chain amino acid transport protein (AzlD)
MTEPIAWLDGPWWPYLALLLFGVLPTEIWRWLAVAFARRLDEDAPLLEWVRSVATALLAAVVAKLVIFPTGALAALPLWVRLGALGVGLAVLALRRTAVLPALVAGLAALTLAGWWLGIA